MTEVTINDEHVLEQKTRKFYAIKNEKGQYIDYSYGSRWIGKVSNARLFNSENGARAEAVKMLQFREKALKAGEYKLYPLGFENSFEKLYVVELKLSEV